MNINLNNYEQYLLMYVDNELSAAQQREVESFLRDYPYLQEELEQLKQIILPLEIVSFNKESLLKPVLDDSLQEKLLMHLDGELPAGESLALQNSLAADKMLSKEWAVLQKTKLDATDIVLHPDKESLYRKERSVIAGRFVRWAVAAMLLGAGFYAGVMMLNRDKNVEVNVANAGEPGKKPGSTVVEPQEKNMASVKEEQEPSTVVTSDDQSTNAPAVAEKDKPGKNTDLAAGDKVSDQKDKLPLQKQTAKLPDNNSLAVNNGTQRSLTRAPEPKELPASNNAPVLKAANNDIAALEKPVNSIDLKNNITSRPPNQVDIDRSASGNAFARTAALGFDESSNDKILMMEEENVSRSKAAIFLKKVKRNVERRTNIKPGKSLRIAGFEFAVK